MLSTAKSKKQIQLPRNLKPLAIHCFNIVMKKNYHQFKIKVRNNQYGIRFTKGFTSGKQLASFENYNQSISRKIRLKTSTKHPKILFSSLGTFFFKQLYLLKNLRMESLIQGRILPSYKRTYTFATFNVMLSNNTILCPINILSVILH